MTPDPTQLKNVTAPINYCTTCTQSTSSGSMFNPAVRVTGRGRDHEQRYCCLEHYHKTEYPNERQ